MNKLLPAASAWFTASAVLGWILWATGQNPAVALAWGWIGVTGAAGYVLANAAVERRRRDADFDEHAAGAFLASGHCCEPGARAWPEPCPWHPDDGRDRLIQDLYRDERRRDH
jgi:hypothetical protein